MLFLGPILVPEVAFWGFWGLVCIEKWSQNFDSGTQNAIFGTTKMAVFAQNPQKATSGTKIGPQKRKNGPQNRKNGQNFLGPQWMILIFMFSECTHRDEFGKVSHLV